MDGEIREWRKPNRCVLLALFDSGDKSRDIISISGVWGSYDFSMYTENLRFPLSPR